MHAHVEVIVPAPVDADPLDIEREVLALLEPYREPDDPSMSDKDYEAWYEAHPFHWDWHQIGGRWRGVHVAGETVMDDLGTERCVHCNGTGTRPDAAQIEAANPGWMDWTGGCNGCEGKGQRTPWPTQWDRHPLDMCLATEAHAGLTAATIVYPDGCDHAGWGEPSLPVKRVEGTWLVTVDCHS